MFITVVKHIILLQFASPESGNRSILTKAEGNAKMIVVSHTDNNNTNSKKKMETNKEKRKKSGSQQLSLNVRNPCIAGSMCRSAYKHVVRTNLHRIKFPSFRAECCCTNVVVAKSTNFCLSFSFLILQSILFGLVSVCVNLWRMPYHVYNLHTIVYAV